MSPLKVVETMSEAKRNEMEAAGQLEEALAHAMKLSAAKLPQGQTGETSSSAEEIHARNVETNRIRDAIKSKFAGYGYPEDDLATLAFDISEFNGACRAYRERIMAMLADSERNPYLVGVALATIGAGLEDARRHLDDLLSSLPKFYTFLADLEAQESQET